MTADRKPAKATARRPSRLAGFDLMAAAFPVFAVGSVTLVPISIYAFATTGAIEWVHSSLSLVALTGFLGALDPPPSRSRRPALTVGLLASTAGLGLGIYRLTVGGTLLDGVFPAWLETATCAFWLGSLSTLWGTRFQRR